MQQQPSPHAAILAESAQHRQARLQAQLEHRTHTDAMVAADHQLRDTRAQIHAHRGRHQHVDLTQVLTPAAQPPLLPPSAAPGGDDGDEDGAADEDEDDDDNGGGGGVSTGANSGGGYATAVMQPVLSRTCHVVADFAGASGGAADAVGPGADAHGDLLSLRRGQLVVVTAVSLDGAYLHGYVHGGSSDAVGRAGLFPAGCVAQTLHEPVLMVGCRAYAAREASELSITPAEEIVVTAKCAGPADRARQMPTLPSRAGHLQKLQKNRRWKQRWFALSQVWSRGLSLTGGPADGCPRALVRCACGDHQRGVAGAAAGASSVHVEGPGSAPRRLHPDGEGSGADRAHGCCGVGGAGAWGRGQ